MAKTTLEKNKFKGLVLTGFSLNKATAVKQCGIAIQTDKQIN